MSEVRGDRDQRSPATHEADLGQRLRMAREYMGLSQEVVADRLGIPRASVSAFEAGKRRVTSLELKELARLYRVPVAHILGEEPEATEAAPDATITALFRAARDLSNKDREQVLRFAEFLREAGRAPMPEQGGG